MSTPQPNLKPKHKKLDAVRKPKKSSSRIEGELSQLFTEPVVAKVVHVLPALTQEEVVVHKLAPKGEARSLMEFLEGQHKDRLMTLRVEAFVLWSEKDYHQIKLLIPDFVDLKAAVPMLTMDAFEWTTSKVITAPWYKRQDGKGYVLKLKYDASQKEELESKIRGEDGRLVTNVPVRATFKLRVYKNYPDEGKHGISARLLDLNMIEEEEDDERDVSPVPQMMEFN